MHKADIIDLETLETAAQGPANPLPLFAQWMAAAEAGEPDDPNAMALATVDPDGKPSVRMVLLKSFDEAGFVFFTNRESRKGNALAAHKDAALCFHWKSLHRQVRIEGATVPVSDAESDAYFETRRRGSQIGAWASQQSRTLDSCGTLAARVKKLDETSGAIIARPPHWGGYRLTPQVIEFWHDGKDRLHTRLLYTRTGNGWERQMLYP